MSVSKFNFLFVAAFCGLMAATTIGQSGETRLLRNPSVSDENVVFTYANDIWIAPRSGGEARQLTSHPGNEFFARLSPDGKWVAFTGQLSGDYEVYLMSASGGEPRRMTYYPFYDQVVGWTPDSKKILFFSRKSSIIHPVNHLLTVSIGGGPGEELPLPDTGYASFSPDMRKIAYNRVSTEYRSWKRYRGGRQSYVSIYDLDSHRYTEVPHATAADLAPMWFENSIYFISDRDGVMNLYRYDLVNRRLFKLTRFTEFDVKYPSLGGSRSPAIIFENGGWLYTYDLKSGQLTQLHISVKGNFPQVQPRNVDAANYINSLELSPDGSSALIGARGDVFTISTTGETRNLTRTSGYNELQPTYSPDGKFIAYFSDRSGEYNLYVRSADDSGLSRMVTNFQKGYLFNPKWSPDSRLIVFSDEKLRLFVVDIANGHLEQIDQSQNNEIFNYSWSPDSKWIAYPKFGSNQFRQIFLYSLDRKQSFSVTTGQFDDRSPVFDPSGRYLFFLSNRVYRPTFQFSGRSDTDWGVQFTDNTGLYCIVLDPGDRSPFSGRPVSGDGKVRFDPGGVTERTMAAPVPLGNYTNLRTSGERLLFISRSSPGAAPLNTAPASIQACELGSGKLESLTDGEIGSFQLSADGKKLIYSGDGYTIVDAAKIHDPSPKKLDVSRMTVQLNPKAEWKQIFNDAWRIERDFYYDPQLNGVDWAAMKRRYEPLLPYVAHRDDLNYLISEMIAELGTGHLYVWGGDLPDFAGTNVGVLGADFEVSEGLFRFKRIYGGDEQNRGPLREPGNRVDEGEYLLAVNGRLLTSKDEPYSFFENSVGKDVVLTINDKPSMSGARQVTVRPIADEMPLRYLDWVSRNRAFVLSKTDGQCGYMHVPNVESRGINEFAKAFYSQIDKQCLVIDARWNSGGYFASFFIDLLSRKTYATYSPRTGNDLRIPQAAIDGPKVMIVNEYNISGGDAFPYFFQKSGIGPVVGVRTAGATIGNVGTPAMIDNGNVETSALALTEKIRDRRIPVLENRGVIPDIIVDNRPDLVIDGRDPQLEAAILAIKNLQKPKSRVGNRRPTTN